MDKLLISPRLSACAYNIRGLDKKRFHFNMRLALSPKRRDKSQSPVDLISMPHVLTEVTQSPKRDASRRYFRQHFQPCEVSLYKTEELKERAFIPISEERGFLRK